MRCSCLKTTSLAILLFTLSRASKQFVTDFCLLQTILNKYVIIEEKFAHYHFQSAITSIIYTLNTKQNACKHLWLFQAIEIMLLFFCLISDSYKMLCIYLE